MAEENDKKVETKVEEKSAGSEKKSAKSEVSGKFKDLIKQPNNIIQEYTDEYGQKIFGAPGQEKLWNEIRDLRKQVRQNQELKGVKKVTEDTKRDLAHQRGLAGQKEELARAKKELDEAYNGKK